MLLVITIDFPLYLPITKINITFLFVLNFYINSITELQQIVNLIDVNEGSLLEVLQVACSRSIYLSICLSVILFPIFSPARVRICRETAEETAE